ncbi:MAG: hypothetical protein LUD02_04275 [Tannerellaceae bacterium]|nr:hypothetical protein [Tannerellaceae bacterium]MCD8263463.1 hypothetical protein [Tannerellaceae bacterium]
MYDEEDNLCIRAGIMSHTSEISKLENVYTHVVELCEQLPEKPTTSISVESKTGSWIAEKTAGHSYDQPVKRTARRPNGRKPI